jgi:hypothetical protein
MMEDADLFGKPLLFQIQLLRPIGFKKNGMKFGIQRSAGVYWQIVPLEALRTKFCIPEVSLVY